MTPSLSQQIEAIEAECRTVVELAEKATAGPWYADPAIKEDERYLLLHNRLSTIAAIDGKRFESNAPFISASRTITPKLARVTLAAIEGLKRQLEFSEGILVNAYAVDSARNILKSICDQWRAEA